MTGTDPILRRPLSYLESSLHWATTDLSSSMICAWAAGTGTVEHADLRHAGAVLHRRHPLLRSRVTGSPGAYEFVTDVPWERIPVEEHALPPGASINQVIEPMMNTPLPVTERCWEIGFVRVPDRDRWWLVLRTHHAMTDGHSVSRLLDQFGELLGHLATGAAIDETPRPLPDPIEHQLDPPGTMDRWTRAAREAADQIGTISPWPVDQEADPDHRRSANACTVFEPAFTSRLIDRCHREGTTVQGALAAAVTQAIAVYLDGPVTIDTITPVDLRRFADTTIDPEEIACKILCLDTGLSEVAPDGDPWAVARTYRDRLQTQLEARSFPPVDFTATDIEQSGLGWMDAEGRHTHGFSLTNTGVLEVRGDYGPIRFEEVDLTATVRWGGFPVLLSACTFRDRLRFTYTWTEPLLHREHAEALAADVESRLQAMVDGHAPSLD